MVRFFLFLSLLVLNGCGCGNRGPQLRIGIDPDWYPINFGPQQPYVNGFVEDLLLEIARYSGIKFERINANWDSLYDGIWEKKYDAVLTSLPAYTFNLAKYDFSRNFLDLGPVLIVPITSQFTELGEMKGEIVGLIENDPASLILQKYPDVIMQRFRSIPDLLNALVNGKIEGALLNRIPAANYIADLYTGKLKIASSPLTHAGLHLIAAKGRQEYLVKEFDKSIEHFKQKKKLEELLKKWSLDSLD